MKQLTFDSLLSEQEDIGTEYDYTKTVNGCTVYYLNNQVKSVAYKQPNDCIYYRTPLGFGTKPDTTVEKITY